MNFNLYMLPVGYYYYIYSFVNDCQVNQGSYFGTFFLHTIRGQVSHLRGLKEAIKHLSKRVGQPQCYGKGHMACTILVMVSLFFL